MKLLALPVQLRTDIYLSTWNIGRQHTTEKLTKHISDMTELNKRLPTDRWTLFWGEISCRFFERRTCNPQQVFPVDLENSSRSQKSLLMACRSAPGFEFRSWKSSLYMFIFAKCVKVFDDLRQIDRAFRFRSQSNVANAVCWGHLTALTKRLPVIRRWMNRKCGIWHDGWKYGK